jgi:Protein of unknown function (DUF3833)
MNPESTPKRRSVLGLGLMLPLALPTVLAGCAGPDVDRYSDEIPALDLRRYFQGRLTAQGLFIDRFGEVKRHFTVGLMGTWQGDKGVLDEDFVYNDGERTRRQWRLTALAGNRYRGEADDLEGHAEGLAAGNSLRWRYRLRLPVQGKTWVVDVDDWMHLIDEQNLLNRAYFSKWGVALGEVQLAFQRVAGAS